MDIFQNRTVSDASSLWNRDFDRLSRRLHQLQADSMGMSVGSLGILHKELRAMINEANLLEKQVAAEVDTLSNVATAPEATCTRRELLRRTDELKTFMDDLQIVEQTILKGRAEAPARVEVQRPAIPEIDPESMKAEMSDVINMQMQAMNDQDQALEHLDSDVRNLKNITHEVHAEIVLHNELLDDITPEVDRVAEHMHQTHETLRSVIKKHSTCMMMVIIMLELLAIILVAIYV
eukprot:GEMP01046650.1.p1 GENE.GEMP01046650.1~~GEMP01046650.1.p1  ORF type:complete len:235 (+),score=57.81 GEMP01046650.1:114-818(+)